MINGHSIINFGVVLIALLVAVLLGGLLLLSGIPPATRQGTAAMPAANLPVTQQDQQNSSNVNNGTLNEILQEQGSPNQLPMQAQSHPFLTPWPSGGTQQSRLADVLYKSSGKVIAQGTNLAAIGGHKLKTYRVEEFALPPGTSIEDNGKVLTPSKAWRVTITGEGFTVGDNSWMIWADSKLLGPGQESTDTTEISTVVFDLSNLRDGATLAVSFGKDGPRTALPEKLHFSSSH